MSIRVRLVVMCLVIALLPAIPLTLLVKTLLEKSFDVGLSTTVEDALQSGVTVSRMHLETLRADFERAVLDIVSASDADDPRSVAHALSESEDGLGWFMMEDETGDPGALLAQLVGGDGTVREREDRVGRKDIRFLETRDRTYQLAVWRAASGRRIVLYKNTNLDFLEAADRVIEGGQIFAQLRLTQGSLSRSFFYPFMIVYGVILLVSLVIALFISQRLADPIRRLARGANIVASGDWNHRVEVKAGGEVGRLVEAFNGMVARLDTQRQRITDMEKMATWREMARHLAHEIKNPLLPIRLTVQELRDQYRGDNDAYKQQLDDSVRVIEDELSHLSGLVKEFSSFARMPEMMPHTGSIDSLVRDVAKLYPQVRTEITVDPPLPEFAFDTDQMRRVLINLFDNAVSVMDDPSRTEVQVSLGRRGDEAVILFADNGPGIPAEHRERVFDPYFTTRKEGSGLGLAMVKNIILLHGGTIQVQSDEGATFEIVLPLGRTVPARSPEKEAT